MDESYRDDRVLGDVSDRCRGDSVSFHLRIYDRVFSRSERFLHLRLSIRRIFQLGGQSCARQDSRNRCVRRLRTLHSGLHLECHRSQRSCRIRNGRRSGLYEMYGLRQRLSERRAVFRFRQTRSRRKTDDQKELFSDVDGRNRRRFNIYGKLFRRLERLPTRPDADGSRHRHRYDISRSQNLKIADRQRFIVLQIQSQSVGQVPKSRLYLYIFIVNLDRSEHSQRLRPLF